MTTIPASSIVSVNPGVIAAGGSGLNLNGLMLSSTPNRVPIGGIAQFASALAVSNYFGAVSPEASMATTYFAGFDNSNIKPGNLLVAQYPVAPVSAFLRGGSLAGVSLTTLQGYSGTLSVTIDGVLKSSAVNLSGATSFTNAAEIIANALGIQGVQAGTFTASITTTTLTVTAVLTGSLAPGDVLSGAGVTAGTYIVAQLSGTTGGVGTYQVSASQTVGSETITAFTPAVQFDSVTQAFLVISGTTGNTSTMTYGGGAMASSLLLTQAQGAVLSQGAIAAVPGTFMTALAGNFQNWATFFTAFAPDTPPTLTNRLAFAQWASTQNNRYVYVVSDTDVTPQTTNPAPNCLAQQIIALGYGAVSINWQPSETNIAAFVSGAVASVDFTQINGRVTFNGRQQTGLTPGVTDPVSSANLLAAGYNFYAAIATANQQFNFYEPGSTTGQFPWLDSLINAVWFTNQAQLSLMLLLQAVFSVPYNATGNALIEQSLSSLIQQGLAFGMYRSGVTLSGSQIAAVNAATGLNIAPMLQSQGWYLFIGAATPTTRQQRGSPPITFFYMDGEAVQKINLSTFDLL